LEKWRSVLLTKYWGDQIKKNELARSIYGGFWWGNPRKREHLKDPGVDGRIILGWIFRKRVGAWTGLIWLRRGTGGGLL